MKVLIEQATINQAESDLTGIKQALIRKGQSITIGTPTSQYAGIIVAMPKAGAAGLTVDFDTSYDCLVQAPTGVTTIIELQPMNFNGGLSFGGIETEIQTNLKGT